jgi:sigma-B regulation protein RsbU (phosphoserine phosphatase)
MSGDIILLYTDGVTEAFNPQRDEQFGPERLAEINRQNENLPAESLAAQIRQTLNEFTQGSLLEDDVTLVVGKVS